MKARWRGFVQVLLERITLISSGLSAESVIGNVHTP
jgi:hypothetical protein